MPTPSELMRQASSRLSVGALFERSRDGRRIRTGALALYGGAVARRPFWKLIHELARETHWLRATFALLDSTRRGVVRADAGLPVFAFREGWHGKDAGLTLLISSKRLSEELLERRIRCCIEAAERSDDSL